MPELVFDCVGATADRYAAGPTLVFQLRIAETTGQRVHAIALQCQLRIEPQKRRYNADEAAGLNDLFGDRSRWADTVRPLQFATISVLVPSFTGSVEVDLAVPCTYDLEIAATSYFHALESGEIPLLMLFSGTVFTDTGNGFSVTRVPWHKETTFALPVTQWRAMMDRFFPNCGWLRLSASTLDALRKFKNERAFATWEQTLTALLAGTEGR